jgi:hypothetical protein
MPSNRTVAVDAQVTVLQARQKVVEDIHTLEPRWHGHTGG